MVSQKEILSQVEENFSLDEIQKLEDEKNFTARTYKIKGFQGDFGIGGSRFVLPTAGTAGGLPGHQPITGVLFQGVSESGHYRYEADVKPNLRFLFGPAMPWVQIRTNQKIGVSDVLAQLYFKKPFAQVTEDEKTVIASVSPSYTMGPPILPVYTPASPRRKGVPSVRRRRRH